jgi:anti-sigma factor ChrR (cupin superfamily)
MSNIDKKDLAAEFVVGTLEAADRDAAKSLQAQDAAFAALVDAWENRLAPLALADGDQPGMDSFDAVEKAILDRGEELPGTFTSRASAAVWQEMLPGLEMRMLRRDESKRRQTLLVRMQPGAIYPQHGHDDQDEEIFILEGDLVIGELVLGAGDFHMALAERVHPQHHSRKGCIALINQGY